MRVVTYPYDGPLVRRTVVGSTLNSLRCHLPKVTLQTVLDEVNRWSVEGISCFRRLVNSLKLPAVTLPEGVRSRLDLLVPLPQPAARAPTQPRAPSRCAVSDVKWTSTSA